MSDLLDHLRSDIILCLGNRADVCVVRFASQLRSSGERVARARREVRVAVVRRSEVVACTLSSAGGDLIGLMAGGPLFDCLIIDEVS